MMAVSGQIDFFLFSEQTPQQVSQLYHKIVGKAPLPNIQALGFHYSKWEEPLYAHNLIDSSNKFNEENFPVDYFWLDLGYTENYMYF